MIFRGIVLLLTLVHLGHFSSDLVKKINAQKSTWTAQELPGNFQKSVQKFSPIGLEVRSSLDLRTHDLTGVTIPTSFDARTKWPKCTSIGTVRNQGACGACWAFATSEVMSDRYCIGHNGTQFEFAPEDVLGCCTECGNCTGGYLNLALNYFVTDGVVSGGDYNTNRGCQPYASLPYTYGIQTSCQNSCINKNYAKSYNSDKQYAKQVYLVNSASIEQMQYEIMINGSVGAYWVVYEDFYYYESGIYQYQYGELSGYHAIKIIGWGEINGVPYWLCVNSWGTGWGEKGLFKVLKGYNTCQIEYYVFTGTSGTSAAKNVILLIFACVYSVLKYI